MGEATKPRSHEATKGAASGTQAATDRPDWWAWPLERIADAAPVMPGWTREAWRVRLEQMAERCKRVNPWAAGEYLRWAAGLTNAGATAGGQPPAAE